MGADFTYEILPLCRKTDERVAELKALIDGLTLDTYQGVALWESCCDDDELDEYKEELRIAVNDYWELDGRRDVGCLQMGSQDITYILTGGMSWGDGPTDAYDIMTKLTGFWDFFYRYAKEDRQDGKAS